MTALPDRLFAAPAGTSGNFALGGIDQRKDKPFVMYLFTGGGYGGSQRMDGLSNGCSTIGISTMQPVEILEQRYPVLFKEFALPPASLLESTGNSEIPRKSPVSFPFRPNRSTLHDSRSSREAISVRADTASFSISS